MTLEAEFTWKQAKETAENLIFFHFKEHLKDVELCVLQGSWNGLTYEAMSDRYYLAENYLRGDVGPELWRKLSEALGEAVTKRNFKNALARAAKLNQPPISRPIDSPKPHLLFPEGSVPLDSTLYLEREGIDRLCYDNITQLGVLLRIKAPHKMGKTSLLTRILAQGKTHHYQTAHIDLKDIERKIIDSLDKFLQWFCVMVGRQLGLDNHLKDYWDTEILGSNDNCTVYFEEYLLAKIDCPLVLGLDGVDRLFPHTEIVEDFLGMLRSWHERGKTTPLWGQLRLILAHSTDVYIPLDLNQSPFNAGVPIELQEFNSSQVATLARCYGLQWKQGEVESLMAMVGGHPYLVSLALYQVASQKTTLTQLLQEASSEVGIYTAYIRQLLQTLQQTPFIIDGFKRVLWSDEPVTLDPIQTYRLHSMGLVKQQSNQVILRCNLYREYFSRVFATAAE
ncbi:MAG: AAA-like domain-containing protein [Snowella sp.]|nr:AAA-like domain-containing protein [Snowella sp.]